MLTHLRLIAFEIAIRRKMEMHLLKIVHFGRKNLSSTTQNRKALKSQKSLWNHMLLKLKIQSRLELLGNKRIASYLKVEALR